MAAKVSLVLDGGAKGAMAVASSWQESAAGSPTKRCEQLPLAWRQQAIAKLAALRRAGPHGPTTEVLLALRESRDAK